jgi:hypothetical protein
MATGAIEWQNELNSAGSSGSGKKVANASVQVGVWLVNRIASRAGKIAALKLTQAIEGHDPLDRKAPTLLE